MAAVRSRTETLSVMAVSVDMARARRAETLDLSFIPELPVILTRAPGKTGRGRARTWRLADTAMNRFGFAVLEGNHLTGFVRTASKTIL